jgi:hypothetical protein
MMTLRLLLLASVLLVLGGGSSALAAGPGSGTCSGGQIAAGTYRGFTVTGNCTFAPGTLTINGNLIVADGAILNDHVASSSGVQVHVTGNVLVGRGAVLGLGNYNPALPHDSATVDGNVLANQPMTLYLGGMTVHGNVVSIGGSGPGRNFPIKDDQIDGNLILQGWSGLWIGVLRTAVGGNVIVANNSGIQTGDEPPYIGVPDSTEIVSNTIRGNLICLGNDPAAQLGDAALEGGGPNTVGGHKLGECASL